MDTRPSSREAWLRETLRRPAVCRRLNQLRVLFIDEVCTVSSSIFSRLSCVMRRVPPPHMQHLPFAGCQLVAAGDTLQIVPVGVSDTFVDRMVFDWAAWRSTFGGTAKKVLCLTGNHRQALDLEFQEMLDRVRWGRMGAHDVDRLNSTSSTIILGPVSRLRIKKVAVQAMNEERLAHIHSPSAEFSALDVIFTTDTSLVNEAVASLRSCVDFSVVLKLGAFVILTRKLGAVAPGSRGVVKRFIAAGDKGGGHGDGRGVRLWRPAHHRRPVTLFVVRLYRDGARLLRADPATSGMGHRGPLRAGPDA
eukprot:TRINITY_DN1210_c0_g1_i1.p2 TRINITY_DN1210_c0_g1~~TRINITY_DN1210_c0_g1_i1.p2  ORF type:complete len:306 (-),score=31.95 TRINITY_DN1210_c0_g1_i1:2355-3272(-)